VYLRRRHGLEASRYLLLPRQARLGIDLRRRLEVLDALVEQTGAQDNVVGAEGLLCVVDVGGAVLAVVAVDALACCMFSILFNRADMRDGFVRGVEVRMRIMWLETYQSHPCRCTCPDRRRPW
jgi:hypothetical protein